MPSKRRYKVLLARRSLLKEENVDLTPLIDCVFMLLIFFMVTTAFITAKGLNVDMPRASSADSQPGKDINVIVEADGRIEVNGESVEIALLPERLEQLRQELQTENMILQAHPNTHHGLIVEIVDMARSRGIAGVALAREQAM